MAANTIKTFVNEDNVEVTLPANGEETHPSHLAYWSARSPNNEVGVLLRVKSIEKVDVIRRETILSLQRRAYRSFDLATSEDLIRKVQDALGGELGGVVAWGVVSKHCPPLKFRNLAREPVVTMATAWIDAADDWSQISIDFEQDMTIVIQDQVSVKAGRAFPFDWHRTNISVAIEPTEENPSWFLRGVVDDSAGYAFRRWKKEQPRLAMTVRRNQMLAGDPDHYTWTYLDDQKLRLCKHSALRCPSFSSEWSVWIHKNMDCAINDPWPYWLSTVATDEQGWRPALDMHFWLQREPHYYLFNSLFILVLIEIMAWYSMAIDYRDLSSRQSFTGMLFISVLVLKLLTAHVAPRMAQLTMFDVRFILSIVYIFLVVGLQHLTVTVSTDHDLWDLVAKVGSGAVFLIMNLGYWAFGFYLYNLRPEAGLAPVA